jgi:transcriptional regulator with XRE-family HTH domain
MTKSADDDTPSGFSVEVGRRLRAVRRGHRLSLDGVEHESGGRWTASAIGAYERGFRNLSLPRLHELALFYEVPTSALLSESGESGTPDVQATSRLVFDLEALGRAPDAAPIRRSSSSGGTSTDGFCRFAVRTSERCASFASARRQSCSRRSTGGGHC